MTGRGRGDSAEASSDGADSHVVDGVDVDALVAAVTSCPSVSGMAAGGLGGAVTLLPGRRVAGVRVVEAEVQVDVRARWGATAETLAREVRAATAALLAGHRLHVLIADIDDPGEPAAAPDATSGALSGTEPPAALRPVPEPIALPAAGPKGQAVRNTTATRPSMAESDRTAVSTPAQADPANGAIGPNDRPASPS